MKVLSLRDRIVLVVTVVVAAAGAWAALGLEQNLTVGGFKDSGSQSFATQRELTEALGVGSPNLVVLVGTPRGAVDDPAVTAAATSVTEVVTRYASATGVQSYWSTQLPYLRSDDGHSGLILAQLPGDEDAVDAAIRELSPRLQGMNTEQIHVGVTGQAEILREATDVSKASLVRAEIIAVPISLVLLILVFGSVVAASVPIALGLLCSLAAFCVIRILAGVLPISVFALNLTTGLALGLAIDYGLLIVARYRELLAERSARSPAEYRVAAVDALRLTRRTVLVSTATIAISLCGVLAVNLGYLRSIAVAGIVVVTLTAVVVLVVLPIMLKLLGTRIDSLTVRRVDLAHPGPATQRALSVSFRHPSLVAVTAVALLIVLLLPFLGVRFGPVDDRVLPADAAPHRTAEHIREQFPQLGSDITFTALPTSLGPADGRALATHISQRPEVSATLSPWGVFGRGVQVAAGQPTLGNDDMSSIVVVPRADLDQSDLLGLARSLREEVSPFGGSIAGTYADELDKQHAIASRAPLVLTIVAIALLPMVFLATGSIAIAIKSMILTALSLTASFGVMVWVFQQGHLASVLNFSPTGTVDVTAPLLLVCLAFGLSLDYQIMLLSRVREEYDRTGDTTTAVRIGIERTAKILSAAALLVGVVFVAIGSGGTTIVKILGIGLASAVLIDAFVVRIALVPALMQLLGRWNWWSPTPLALLYERMGLERRAAPVEAGTGRDRSTQSSAGESGDTPVGVP